MRKTLVIFGHYCTGGLYLGDLDIVILLYRGVFKMRFCCIGGLENANLLNIEYRISK